MKKTNDMEVKLNFYNSNKTPVHITCSMPMGETKFYNGKIIEINSDKGFLILKDNKFGDVPIIFTEIINIDPFKEKFGK